MGKQFTYFKKRIWPIASKINKGYEDGKTFNSNEALDEDLRLKDGYEHAFYNQFNSSWRSCAGSFSVFKNKKAIGCGALKIMT